MWTPQPGASCRPLVPALSAWAVVALTVLAALFGLVVAARVAGPAGLAASIPESTLAIPFAVTGSLIVVQRPRNRVGWLFVVVGGFAGVAKLLTTYAFASIGLAETPWPGTVWAAYLGNWLGEVPVTLLLVYLPLTYPTGRLMSLAWRPFAWVSTALLAMFWVAGLISPESVAVGGGIEGGLVVFPPPMRISGGAAVAVFNLVTSVAVLCVFLVATWSLRLRYQRATGVEQLQIKWLLYAAASAVSLIAVLVAVYPLIPIGEVAFDTVVAAIVWAFPTAVAAAVLRYRLFDIDRLIRRTVTYGVVSVTVAGVYAVGVVAGQRLLPLTVRSSSYAVAIATLVAAGMFAPLRGRVQALVDRRFNRSRYNAIATLDAFRSRALVEVDLDQLINAICSVISSTMSPSHTEVWLRPSCAEPTRSPSRSSGQLSVSERPR